MLKQLLVLALVAGLLMPDTEGIFIRTRRIVSRILRRVVGRSVAEEATMLDEGHPDLQDMLEVRHLARAMERQGHE